MAKPNSILACCRALVVALLATSLSASADIPVKWTTDTFKVKPLVYECYHGETLDLESSLTSYGEPLALSGETARLYWQTNGMGSAWWTTNAAVRVDADTGATNILAATFSGAFDTGAKSVTGFIGIEGKNYRAAFQLNFRDSPGFAPNALPIPPQKIDWANVANANVDAAPFVVKGGAGGMTPTQVTNISTFVASSATVTNAGAVAAAQAMTNGKLDSHHDISGFDTSIAWDDDAGALKVDGAPLSVEQLKVSNADSIMIDGVPINSCTKIEDSTIKLWSNELTVVPVSGGAFSGNVGFGSNGAYIDSLGNAYFCSFSMMSDWVNLSAMGVNLPTYLASTEWHGTNKSLTDYGITNTIPSKTTIETYAINAVSNSDNLWNASNTKLTATIDGRFATNNTAFTTAVLAVGLNIDTNAVAVLNEISSGFGGFPIAGTATTIGGLLAALAAAVAWLKKKSVKKDSGGYYFED